MDTPLLKKFDQIEKTHWWWQGRRNLIKNLTRDKLFSSILDIGCGTGETISFLKKLFPKAKIYGVDNHSQAIKISRQKHSHIRKAHATRLPFKKQTFDLILFLDVLEHVKDHQNAIKEAKRVLKKNGQIIITAPALKLIWSAHDTNQGHFRRYTRTEIKRLSQKNKLKLKYISYFNFFFSLPIISIRLLGNLPPLSFLNEYNSGLNYEIANKKTINSFFAKIFRLEINLLSVFRYPFGISIVAVLEKNN